jgi:hypothetical protein
VDRHHTRPKAIADVTIAHAQGQAVDVARVIAKDGNMEMKSKL